MGNGTLTLGRLNSCSFDEALLLRNRGFEQYFNDLTTTMTGLLQHFGKYAIQPELSVIAYWDGKLAGFVFLAIKHVGKRKLAWNGGTGVFPEYRGKGIAKAMMLEVERILIEQEVDLALLEVIVQNQNAISAYQKGGFQIVDRLISYTREGIYDCNLNLPARFSNWKVRQANPMEVSRLPYYRDLAAWECQWHQFCEGNGLILSEPDGKPVGYALYERNYGDDGQLSSISLYQCEVAPDQTCRKELYQLLLTEVFGPSHNCKRLINNLSMADPVLIELLSKANFKIRFEQFLMIREKKAKLINAENGGERI